MSRDATSDDTYAVYVAGMLDIYAVDDLLAAMRQAVERPENLEVDLGGAASLHTAALQVLLAAARACSERGRSLRLGGVSEEVAATLRRTGLDHLLLPAGGP